MPKVFAYGAIMDHGVAKAHGRRAFLRDHAVTFCVRGIPLFEPRFLGLRPAPGKTAWGVLVEMDDAHWARCVRSEVSYEVVTVDVVCGGDGGARDDHEPSDDEEVHQAYAFLVQDKWVASEGAPSARYAARLWRGAKHHGLPEHVVARYRELRDTGGRASKRLGPLLPVIARVIGRCRGR